MKLAAVQFRADQSDLLGSRARLLALLESAADPADLVVLPELASTGYVFDHRDEVEVVAEPARGPSFQAWSRVARARRCWVVGGFAERDGADLYNSALVIDPEGELRFCYRKTLLFDADKVWALAGNLGYRTFATSFGTMVVGICMDFNDMRFWRYCWTRRPQVIALPTAWTEEGIDVWEYWQRPLQGLQAVMVAANIWGVERRVPFHGRSVILSGERVYAGADHTGDGVVRVVIEARAAAS